MEITNNHVNYERYSKSQLIELIQYVEENDPSTKRLLDQYIREIEIKIVSNLYVELEKAQKEYYRLSMEFSKRKSQLVDKYSIPVNDGIFKLGALIDSMTHEEIQELLSISKKADKAYLLMEKSEEDWRRSLIDWR